MTQTPGQSASTKPVDVEYAVRDGISLLARMHVPEGKGPYPLVIEIHGGTWMTGDRHSDAALSDALAQRGVMVAAIDFRMPPASGYPASMQDINSAVRWFRKNAARFNISPERIGVLGTSSGAHQAIICAMTSRGGPYTPPTQEDLDDIDPTSNFAVLCWPVIDPASRFQHFLGRKDEPNRPPIIDIVLAGHAAYWKSPAALVEASPLRILEEQPALELPPVLYCQGDGDVSHPLADTTRFVEAYRRRGGQLEYFTYAAAGTAPPPPGQRYAATLDRLIEPDRSRFFDAIAAFVRALP